MTTKRGTYVLLLEADSKQIIEVGALGDVEVCPGIYVYVGSAFGPGGLRARVERHARNGGALHWHVDYLRAMTTLRADWYTCDPELRECLWAEIFREWPASEVPANGFGASDCNCPAHLVRFEEAPTLDAFRRRLRSPVDEHGRLHRRTVDAMN